eukprot:Skav230716  [mRNA]  locus=scaffold715:216443:227001:- [translate_table: standard]
MEARQTPYLLHLGAGPQDLGAIRINVVSKSFWDNVERIFGATVASLGKALLPFTLKERPGQRKTLTSFLGVPSSGTRVELLSADPESICGSLQSGAGIRNALWLCAFREFWQLMLDLAHLLLLLFLGLAPWRLLQCVYLICRPSQVWHGILAKKLSTLLLVKQAMLKPYHAELQQRLNLWAKNPPQRRKTYSILQNAASSYWLGLNLCANLQLTKQNLNHNEHALVVERISAAQSRADELLLTSAADMQEPGGLHGSTIGVPFVYH